MLRRLLYHFLLYRVTFFEKNFRPKAEKNYRGGSNQVAAGNQVYDIMPLAESQKHFSDNPVTFEETDRDTCKPNRPRSAVRRLLPLVALFQTRDD